MASPQSVASPRRSRGFSLKSDKSHHSSNSGSHHKVHLSESAEEKHRRTLHTKADPMVAMSEAQPMAVALEKSNLGNLRAMQHKDQFGNVITDPDLSNPTRPRLERPLDTIRSFEAAIYGTYTGRPASYAKTGHNGYANRGYGEQEGYYNGRGTYSRPDSYVEGGYGAGPPPENYYPYNQMSGRPRPRHHPRMNSEHYGNNASNGYAQNGYAQNGYGQNGYHKSYENVTAASGSGSNTEPWGNSTDPSSVNSSIDQLQQQQRMDERSVADNFGFQGFGPGPNLNGKVAASGGAGPERIVLGNNQSSAPATDSGGPVGGGPAPTTRRQLRKTNNVPTAAPAAAGDTKRKSWFKRRFSKD
ncbi:conserved hypothetical protein [Aspergillus terreus NIH2624]|uniref:DUF2406 domain-containing protein n=1 Tax=Aspergillus terreus (strain NIH 2624 / FGSC A1156) TaxID=341663 RepID=Q0CXF9_ASPTN|nr:uncharacterized protein ATEG_01625 [Aspergillus terreus NIH2624]EAU38382.1 conserved hypothetical protein [Aspergillus terreus NIH2624]